MKSWYEKLLKTKSIYDYDFKGENPPYKYYRFETNRNKTISGNVMVGYIKQLKDRFCAVDDNDILSLLELKGFGVSKLALVHHYLLGEWVDETILIAHDIIISLFKKGDGGYNFRTKKYNSGHTVWSEKDIVKAIEAYHIKDDESFVDAVFNYLVNLPSVKMFNNLYSYQSYFAAEKRLFELAGEDSALEFKTEKKYNESTTQEQRLVCDAIMDSNDFISILQAPAGHGKTYATNEIVKHCKSFSVVAPTGKASLNFKESIPAELSGNVKNCTTVHSLYYRISRAKTSALRELRSELLVVDEASMISSEILVMILKIAGKLKVEKILLLGDYYQCPPVGCGFPFYDIIKHYPDLVHTLSTNMRTKDEMTVALFDGFRNAMSNKDVNTMLKYATGYKHSVPKVIELQDRHYKQILDGKTIVTSYRNAVVDYYNHRAIQYLYGHKHKGLIGDIQYRLDGMVSDNGNLRKRKFTDPSYKGFIPNGIRLFLNENGKSGTLEFSNGSVIVMVDNGGDDYPSWKDAQRDSNMVTVRDDQGEIHTIMLKDIYSISRPAFAGTVHKLQGSGYSNVLFVATGSIQADIFYTAITRAKDNLFISYDDSLEIKNIDKRKTVNNV